MTLKRKFYDTLLNWKKSHLPEGLLVKGARQIGKTFTIDSFGRENYRSYLYVNFVTNPEYRNIFAESLEAADLYRKLSAAFANFRIIPGDTLIFLDEIQNCPRARTAFKPLSIDGKVDVIASGSLLGISFLDDDAKLNAERRESSIPVGYERQLTMYSLDFEEYLWAIGYRPEVIDETLRRPFASLKPVPEITNRRFLQLFRDYIVIGGMPEVVATYLESNNYNVAFDVQRRILSANLDDIARYAPMSEKPKVRACYLSIPNQLARENKKFKYASVVEHGRSRMFYASIDWLRESALVFQCPNVETPEIPLSVYKKEDCFKLYASDSGILVSMVGFPAVKAILDNTLKGFAKGGIYENAIMSLLVRRGYTPYYFHPKSNLSEIDFLIEGDNGVIPIEVKSGNDSSASFDRFLERPETKIGYKFVNGNLGKSGKKVTLPHYMAMFV